MNDKMMKLAPAPPRSTTCLSGVNNEVMKRCRRGYQPPVITVKNVRDEVLNIKIGVVVE